MKLLSYKLRPLTCRLTPLALLLCLAGCGEGGPSVVPVSGKVLIDGQPLGYGFVQVLATGWRPATGKIGPDGRFTLTTTTEGDGCAVGTHPVVILAGEPISEEKMIWHAPEKYTSTDAGLTVTITGPTKDLVIELSSAGAKLPNKKTTIESETEQGFKFDK